MSSNPDDYKKGRQLQSTNTLADIEGRHNRNAPSQDLMLKFEIMVNQIVTCNINNIKDLDKLLKQLRREFKITPKKSQLLWVYKNGVRNSTFDLNPKIIKLLQKKPFLLNWFQLPHLPFVLLHLKIFYSYLNTQILIKFQMNKNYESPRQV